MSVFWHVAPYSLVEINRPHNGGSKHIWNVRKFHQTTRCNIPQDSHRHTRRRENLKSRKVPTRLSKIHFNVTSHLCLVLPRGFPSEIRGHTVPWWKGVQLKHHDGDNDTTTASKNNSSNSSVNVTMDSTIKRRDCCWINLRLIRCFMFGDTIIRHGSCSWWPLMWRRVIFTCGELWHESHIQGQWLWKTRFNSPVCRYVQKCVYEIWHLQGTSQSFNTLHLWNRQMVLLKLKHINYRKTERIKFQ
jgi:hypothetical protein